MRCCSSWALRCWYDENRSSATGAKGGTGDEVVVEYDVEGCRSSFCMSVGRTMVARRGEGGEPDANGRVGAMYRPGHFNSYWTCL